MDAKSNLMYIAMDMKTRKYDMGARQEAKSATRDAIISAAIDTFMAERSFAITLAAVAERAGVTVKTVLRHFGSREALIDTAWSQLYDEVAVERTPPPGDPEAALDVLIAHYKRRGDMVLTTLASEDVDARARRMNDRGRLGHRAWVEEVFGARLPTQQTDRSRLIDVLVVATDVYSWKLLRIDRGLSVADVRDRMLLMTQAILAAPYHSAVEGSAQ
jgi:AcrR family transcriptional regulator